MTTSYWNSLSPLARQNILMACGWVTRNGNLNPTGKRLFKTNWGNMPEFVHEIIIRHLRLTPIGILLPSPTYMTTSTQSPAHTAGPWNSCKGNSDHLIMYTNGVSPIAFVNKDLPSFQANALLIAAAPDLLEACIAAHIVLQGSGDKGKALSMIDAAVAKAS